MGMVLLWHGRCVWDVVGRCDFDLPVCVTESRKQGSSAGV